MLRALALVLSLAACGTATESDDTTDAGSGADAGTTADAGTEQAARNLGAVGTWTLSGTSAAGCGMNLQSGFAGEAVTTTTDEFKLTLASKFNEQAVVLRCQFGVATKFTCTDYTVGMTFGTCNANGGMSTISGHISGTTVDLVGTVHSTGTGACPPTVHCGPKELEATGSVAAP